jgi:hypothetical protein
MTTSTRYYKFLNLDGTTPQGYGTWHLPKGKRPGKWMKVTGDLVPCKNGLHVMRLGDLLVWAAKHLYEVEVRGEVLPADDKVVARQARVLRKVDTWNDRNLRLFACDCAERVLPLFEKDHPNDNRPRAAIETARRFANGQATWEELDAARAAVAAAWAAWDAARAAAWAAAWDAAWDAAKAAAWDAAGAAAGDAAWDAAWDAVDARDAAWDAARDDERDWQLQRLAAYLDGTGPGGATAPEPAAAPAVTAHGEPGGSRE